MGGGGKGEKSRGDEEGPGKWSAPGPELALGEAVRIQQDLIELVAMSKKFSSILHILNILMVK